MGAYRGTMRRVLAIFWPGPAHLTPPSQPFSAKNGRKTEGAKRTTTAILHDGSVLGAGNETDRPKDEREEGETLVLVARVNGH